MEETRSVILQVTVDQKAAQAKMVEVEKQIRQVKKEEQELAKVIKESGVATDEQVAKQLQLKGTLKELQTEQRAQQKVVENSNRINQANTGSITQLRAELAVLTAAWNDLSEEERENVEIGGRIQKATKETSDRLKGLESSVGDTRRSVGSYKDSILEAAGQTTLLGGITAKINGVQQEFTAIMNFSKAAMLGNASAAKILRLALISTGIGAIVVLLGGLVAWLTKTQEGIDFVSQKTKGFTTVLGVLIDNLAAIGKRLIDFVSGFENLGDAAKKLGQLLLDNLISRFKGLGVIIEGIVNRDFTKIQDGVAQVATGVTDATAKAKAFATELNQVRKSAEAIEKETQRIRDAELELNKERSRSRAQIASLKKTAEDTTKSEKERIAAAQQALAIENGLLSKQQQLQQDKINNIKAERSLTNNLYEDNKLLAEEEAKLEDLKAESLEKQIELNNKLNGLRKEEAAKRAENAKALEEREYNALVKRLADEKAALDLSLLRTEENSQQRLDAQIKLNEKEREIALAAKDLTANQTALIQAQYDEKELVARKAFAEKLIELEKEAQEKKKAELEKQITASQRAEAERAGREQLEAMNRYANGETFEYQYQQRLNDIQRESLQRQLEEAKKYGQSTLEIERQLAADKIAVRQEESDRKTAIAQAEYQTALVVSQALGDLASIIAGQSASAGEFAKAITLFQIGIDTARALSAITASSAQVAASVAAASGPAGLITGPAAYASYYATNVATVLANIAAAKKLLQGDAPKAPGFAEGGYTGSGFGSPDSSGYKVAGVVHEGEYVLTKKMVQNNPALVKQLEQMRLRGYANGGMVTAMPPSTRNYFTGQDAFDYRRMGQELAAQVSKVNIFTKVSDINSSQARQTAKARIVNQ